MDERLVQGAEEFLRRCDAVDYDLRVESSALGSYSSQLAAVISEQSLVVMSRGVLGDVRQALTKSSLEYCESLATSAVQSIFNVPYRVKYSPEDQKFVLDTGEFLVDLSTNEGGGMVTVISFVFNLYLIIKQGVRRVMLFDEAWTQVSATYFPAFIGFVRQTCHDLGFDVLLVTHDERLTEAMVDHVYFMSEGVARKLK